MTVLRDYDTTVGGKCGPDALAADDIRNDNSDDIPGITITDDTLNRLLFAQFAGSVSEILISGFGVRSLDD
ncbi:hypothetical protein [Nocardia sp. NRRL WC-3656]|uniref:hypothetical protein n=1 Tax=Nocardia sp. NRRL WC-3656 TaxID=1463824 RepID=UPI0004C2DA85|nr:hypothetical protein [Nocardia sp. NRRL WC-3656]